MSKQAYVKPYPREFRDQVVKLAQAGDRAACRAGLRRRLVEVMPGPRRDPAQLLRHPALPDGVLLLPVLDSPVRDDAQETPAAGHALGHGPRSPVTQCTRSRAPGRLPQSAAIALRLDKRQVMQTAASPRQAAPHGTSTIADRTSRASLHDFQPPGGLSPRLSETPF